jgi:hypothetical protein
MNEYIKYGIYMTKYYSTIKNVLIYVTTLMKYYKWKKPVTKDHVLYDDVYIMSRIGKFRRNEDWVPVGLGYFLRWWKCPKIDLYILKYTKKKITELYT